MAFWDLIRSWAEQNTERYIYHHIPPNRTDIPINPDPLPVDAAYFRLWLSEMHLARSREWFTEWYPAVQASVNMRFGDSAPVTFSRVVRAPQSALSKGVLMNYTLTDLIPYRGGVVEIEAALMAFQGKRGTEYIAASLGILETFGSLIAPPFTQAVQITGAMNKSIDQLIAAADGRVHLSLHQAFVSGDVPNALRAGYVAVILAQETEVNPAKLFVRENQLIYNGAPLTGYDYILLQIERRSQRDDWQFSYIDDLMDKIAQAYQFGQIEQAETFRKALAVAIYDSNDFTFTDKKRIITAIRRRLEFFTQQDAFAELEPAASPAPPSVSRMMSEANLPEANLDSEEDILTAL